MSFASLRYCGREIVPENQIMGWLSCAALSVSVTQIGQLPSPCCVPGTSVSPTTSLYHPSYFCLHGHPWKSGIVAQAMPLMGTLASCQLTALRSQSKRILETGVAPARLVLSPCGALALRRTPV